MSAADLLSAMSPAERRAHKALAAEMSVSDEALGRATARAMAAAAFLGGRSSEAPRSERDLATVTDLTAYRLERAQRAAMVGR